MGYEPHQRAALVLRRWRSKYFLAAEQIIHCESGFQPTSKKRDVSYRQLMRKKYVIQWKSKVNGRIGKGSKLFDREEAQRLVEELNLEYPQIEHEILNY